MCDRNVLNQKYIAMGNQHRLEMLVLMMEGIYFTAKELSYSAGLMPSAATPHLKAPIDNGLVKTFRQEKFKYFTLKSPDVASVVESVLCLASSDGIHRKFPNTDVCQARYCFNHLAGHLVVLIYTAMLQSEYIVADHDSKAVLVTKRGTKWLQKNNFLPDNMKKLLEKNAIQCMDWTERVPTRVVLLVA
ncbi:winged helix-turn-helix transcriptional regulator [Pantoea sp. Eser]|nr:winged helix-turn-helix transcriptional regulator [Pantoea sp. Eser]